MTTTDSQRSRSSRSAPRRVDERREAATPGVGGMRLPHSEESERAVLAAVLIDAERNLPHVAGRLIEDDFYFDRHQRIYGAMLELQADNTEIDLRTVQAKLEQKDALELIGGLSYLAGLDVDLPDLSRVENYSEIIKERSLRRRLIEACTEIYRECLDGGLEADEALGRAEQRFLALGDESIVKGFSSIHDVLAVTIDEIEALDGQSVIGTRTGFHDLDRTIQGLNPGNLLIVAGRPGMGKTSLALNISQHAAIHEGVGAAIFSLEMSEKELALRVLSSESDVEFSRVRSGRLTDREKQTIRRTQDRIGNAPFFIDDSSNPSLLEVSSKARRLKKEGKLGLLILDYLQLMSAGGKYENRNLEIAAISRGLKQLAKELEIPVIALSQLSRQPERRGSDHRPQLADLRESGAIEQDADIVMFVYRDEVYHPDDPDNKGLAELIVSKNRHGQTGTIELSFLGDTTTFRTIDRHAVPPPGFESSGDGGFDPGAFDGP